MWSLVRVIGALVRLKQEDASSVRPLLRLHRESQDSQDSRGKQKRKAWKI